MNRVFFHALPVLAIAALAACSGGATNQPLVPQGAQTTTADGEVPFVSADPVRRFCPQATAGWMECSGSLRIDVMPTLRAPQVQRNGESCPFSSGYCPNDLQAAYDLPSLTKGTGTTVAIVDAFGYKQAASDLTKYRKTMGLPACGTSTKCLRIVNQQGKASPLPPQAPPSQAGWLLEQGLDLDMVSAICPNCKLVLVETKNNSTANLYAGVKTAGKLAKYVGLSWGGPESGPDNPNFHQAGVVITASAGDDGGGTPLQPCTFTYVVCAGGTHLVRDSKMKRGWNETVYNDLSYDKCGSGSSSCGATGSACSKYIAKPSWQTDSGCKMRSASDASAVASLRTPVITYNTALGCTPPKCFYLAGGTSVASQIISGVYALAGNAVAQTGASGIWAHHAGNLNDVTQGNNIDPKLGVKCASSVKYICTAGAGFDGPTGWGTPEGLGAF